MVFTSGITTSTVSSRLIFSFGVPPGFKSATPIKRSWSINEGQLKQLELNVTVISPLIMEAKERLKIPLINVLLSEAGPHNKII